MLPALFGMWVKVAKKAPVQRWLCVTLPLLFMGKSRPKISESVSLCFQNCYSATLSARMASLVTSPLTIRHVLFNQALGAPVATGSLQGVIGTVRGR